MFVSITNKKAQPHETPATKKKEEGSMSTSGIQTAIKHFDDTTFGLLLIQHFFGKCLFLVSTDYAITTIPIPSLALVLKGLRTYWSLHCSQILPAKAGDQHCNYPHPESLWNVPFGLECDFFGGSVPLLGTLLFPNAKGSHTSFSRVLVL